MREEKNGINDHTCQGLPTMHCRGWVRVSIREQRRSKALPTLCWKPWTSLSTIGAYKRRKRKGSGSKKEQ